jgi:hypothetical protein
MPVTCACERQRVHAPKKITQRPLAARGAGRQPNAAIRLARPVRRCRRSFPPRALREPEQQEVALVSDDDHRPRRPDSIPPDLLQDDRFPGGPGHVRAAAMAAATSSTSASAIVRQSSRQRPSRTRAITGVSAPRSGAASSSSTAQAKLGSSASGRAPPPTRPTVCSTSPPTRPASHSARARTAARGSPSILSTGISCIARSGSR